MNHVEDINAIRNACRWRDAWSRRGRDAFKGVVVPARVRAASLGCWLCCPGGARLSVWEVGLPGVRKQGHDDRDASGGAHLACRDHDAKLDEVIVDAVSCCADAEGLDDVYILAAERVLDLASCLARGKLGEDSLQWDNAQRGTDTFHELGVCIRGAEGQ